ncbi:hypothetical protein DSCOOX_18630 [Desulfosarcina ovata subsp. ovata]|uniref:Uncharacterized protein n=1 Tax=Desulfosarcina ovata subsp. ovata TaxID=2752305 RepID=A0A5K8A7R2_9BACT|nr:hypothetical protein DSCOOX_18630 [Desulfosarcina ovata subsp. ovata]
MIGFVLLYQNDHGQPAGIGAEGLKFKLGGVNTIPVGGDGLKYRCLPKYQALLGWIDRIKGNGKSIVVLLI